MRQFLVFHSINMKAARHRHSYLPRLFQQGDSDDLTPARTSKSSAQDCGQSLRFIVPAPGARRCNTPRSRRVTVVGVKRVFRSRPSDRVRLPCNGFHVLLRHPVAATLGRENSSGRLVSRLAGTWLSREEHRTNDGRRGLLGCFGRKPVFLRAIYLRSLSQ